MFVYTHKCMYVVCMHTPATCTVDLTYALAYYMCHIYIYLFKKLCINKRYYYGNVSFLGTTMVYVSFDMTMKLSHVVTRWCTK